MLTTARPSSDLTAGALAHTADRGITVEPWPPPDQTHPREDLDQPVLYLVAPDAQPPRTWGPLEDWIRTTADNNELYHRADRLLDRAFQFGALSVSVDDDDILRVGASLTILSTLEARLFRVLLAALGEVVSRERAIASVWPDGAPSDTRALDNRLKMLRQRLTGLPFGIHTVRGRGLLLEWDAPATDTGRGDHRVRG
ncbi:MAG: winged helix-turn-helix domain-containing protein [Acidimicrobiales bacterium]